MKYVQLGYDVIVVCELAGSKNIIKKVWSNAKEKHQDVQMSWPQKNFLDDLKTILQGWILMFKTYIKIGIYICLRYWEYSV